MIGRREDLFSDDGVGVGLLRERVPHSAGNDSQTARLGATNTRL